MAKRSWEPEQRAPSTEPTPLVVTDSQRAWREAIESVVIAIVLAFLFRAFEAEAFVIPTGSMAPTLQGRHKDVLCPECGYRYQAGDTSEADGGYDEVVAVTCPLCKYTQAINPQWAQHLSNTGDRILVNKFAYEKPFGEPHRWDVIVFKFPGNAKQNYIKRLIGLENETIRIEHGDIFTRPIDDVAAPFKIARKPPHKLTHMLQLIADTEHEGMMRQQVGWPADWQPLSENTGWTTEASSHACRATDETSWLRYGQHYTPFEAWDMIQQTAERGATLPPNLAARPSLVTDFYAYNAQSHPERGSRRMIQHPLPIGMHWVGDLAVEAEVKVGSDAGELWFDLVEGGWHHRCRVDVATGKATLSINDGQVPFVDESGEQHAEVSAATACQGRGTHSIRFTNVDDELRLWIDNRLCTFDHPTTFAGDRQCRPQTSPEDPGDLRPVGIGARQLDLQVERLRVLRDIYYIATRSSDTILLDYDLSQVRDVNVIREHLLNPEIWKSGDLFDARQQQEFTQEADQFLAMGDNSPASQDSRLWPGHHYVSRDMLIGEAVCVYWPHAIMFRVPFTNKFLWGFPNFREMEMIH